MTERDNEARLGANAPEERASSLEKQEVVQPLSFAAPTEMVEIPSEGRFYPEGHPLHNVKEVEIKFMTAKEEDILTSPSLLKKGVALDRFLKSVIIQPKVEPDDMLVGDKNALLVAARITGYGSTYEAKVVCPACDAKTRFSFDVEREKIVKGGDSENAVPTEHGTWTISLPKSKWEIEVRLLTGLDERKLVQSLAMRKKNKMEENLVTEQLKMMTLSVKADKVYEDRQTIEQAIENMPATDARFLRGVVADINPSISLEQDFTCSECDHTAKMEVPFDTDFFWLK